MTREKTVAIIGQGYVGLPLSIAATNAGWRVYGIDVAEWKIQSLVDGLSYVEDVSDQDLVKALREGFPPTSDYAHIGEASIAIICVPTPIDHESRPDLQPLISAVKKIGEFALPSTLVINESTSYPTTVRKLIPSTIKEVDANLELLFAVAPERVDPGNKAWSYQRTPRLVSGLTPEATTRAVSFYSSFCENVVEVSTPEIAEFSKVLENSFRQVNIALVNELAPLARLTGISIFDVIEAAATKPYGFMPFWPGVGVGGHCIPVDPMYLSWFARQNGMDLQLIESAQAINAMQPSQVAKLISEQALSKDSQILVVGIAYKAGSKDLRESPSLELIKQISVDYPKVEWWDESIDSWNETFRSKLANDFDLIVVTHPINSEVISEALQRAKKIIDCTGRIRGLNNTISI